MKRREGDHGRVRSTGTRVKLTRLGAKMLERPVGERGYVEVRFEFTKALGSFHPADLMMDADPGAKGRWLRETS